MDDLHGLAAEKLAQFTDIHATEAPSVDWLTRQLFDALRELAAIEPVADAEEERREDF